jgi:hypothetical protein
MKLTQLFCDVDDFCQSFILEWQKNQKTNGEKKRNRRHRMSFSEMTILLIKVEQPVAQRPPHRSLCLRNPGTGQIHGF